MAWTDRDHLQELNRRWWDERVPIHVGSDFYAVDRFRAGRGTLEAFEIEELGDVTGRSLVHLQCHFGLDTLSWARLGAEVTGLDFSAPAVDAARELADGVGLPATFVAGDVYDASRLLGRRYDVVYTGKGALNWLPDMEAWAGVVTDLLAPGGRLYLSEFHPVTWVFGGDDLTVAHDYFPGADPLIDDGPGTYADLDATTVHNQTGEWAHPLGEIVSALAGAGLRIEWLHEHPYTLFPRWPDLEVHDDGSYRFPAGRPSIPLMFSLVASAP